ncbi:MAG: alpha/beta hydrolase [Rhodobacteraceae bacterium]|nr:alpha/beta hydrolase [Paracoccaceae bacterium]
MTTPQTLTTPQNRSIAHHQMPGSGPGVVFLGGFKSDMEGTKALYLEDWAKAQGRAFLRFDYSGHGQSSGDFLDGSIGEWAEDAMEAIKTLTEGPQILVGSSMGGWISLLVARAMPGKLTGLVGIAAAPDFTEDSMWDGFSKMQRAEMKANGQIELPSDYSDEPYIITEKLIEDGRNQLVLRDPLPLAFPVRLLHGTADVDVAMSVPLRIVDHVAGDDVRLTLVKDADHRFSEPDLLDLIVAAIGEIDTRLQAGG